MNTLREEAVAKFDEFFNTVNPETISVEATKVFMTAPTKWTRYVQIAVANYYMQTLEDIEERNQFASIFHNLSEQIATSTSLVQFVAWLEEAGLSFVSYLDNLKLVNKVENRDGYDVMELFVEKFYQ